MEVIQIPFSLATAVVAIAAYLLTVKFLRYRLAREIEKMPDPTDGPSGMAIYQKIAFWDFPFITQKALEFALFRTYGIPSIAKTLCSTKEMTQRCNRRYDDTSFLLAEILEHFNEPARCGAAMKRMNYIHSLYPINNDDYLYVLTTFICEPGKWIERFGYRSLTTKEKNAIYHVWVHIATEMGIREIPTSYEAMCRFEEQYERTHMRYSEHNAALAESTSALFLSIIPAFLRPIATQVVHALCDQRLRDAMGFSTPVRGYTWSLEVVGWTAKMVARHCMLPRRTPHLQAADKVDENGKYVPKIHAYKPTYKCGYRIEDLGPEHLVGKGPGTVTGKTTKRCLRSASLRQ
ncbi:uncharacterized protein EV422DRAFT_535468 [Fimicolochytrium jonesii]|uniref:uncharacterized protein n=1 Tax=Fimicolochytrium jonesii TaxID=1396493 RepID=UPI0022FE626E|nr:uncharacterized protein EV422DRAFT_535468 [Fimicolochytrium jonesii]KAI8819200.1 hypothetical protein EV422DRAFT_535468 [Fimicolochytrium jonesii]